MRIYKITAIAPDAGNILHWARSKADARMVIRAMKVEHDDEVFDIVVSPIQLPPTKGDVIRFLRRHCPDRDNG